MKCFKTMVVCCSIFVVVVWLLFDWLAFVCAGICHELASLVIIAGRSVISIIEHSLTTC